MSLLYYSVNKDTIILFLFSSYVFISILELLQSRFVCLYTERQWLEFVWCGTRGDLYGTRGDLVVGVEGNFSVSFGPNQDFVLGFGLGPSWTIIFLT